MTHQRAQWGSRVGFILAASGSAVGLGNIWKFPYITGENGGGLFVLIYLVCIALVGVPIMMAEIMIGRAAQKQPVAAFPALQGKRTGWAAIGWMGVLAGFLILSYYIVVAGWALDYTLKSVVNFTEPIHQTADEEATKYRATATLDEMTAELIDRAVEKDRVASRETDDVTRQLPPSAWRNYALYVDGLGAAGVTDMAVLEATRNAWATASEAAAAHGPGALAEPDDAAQRRYESVRAILFEKDDLRAAVEQAEPLLQQREAARVAAFERAVAHYSELARTDEVSLRSEAEDLARRNVISTRVQETFVTMASDGWMATLWSAIFMLITILIVAGGISNGIERTCKVLMPTLFVLILTMVIYGATRSGFGEALSFVFKPDVHKLKASGVLEALGHAFFTLSLGMGAMITYGSYQRTKTGLAGEAATIAVLDTLIALLACLMMFPIIFTYDQDAAAGPGLVFMSMPLAFAEMGMGGMFLAILFFGLLVFAALTSAISLLEVVASYFIDDRGWSRPKAVWTTGAAIFVFGVLSAFAMDSDFAMTGWEASYEINFFDTMDYLTSNWMLPLGGLFIAIYAGWVMPRRLRNAEMEGMAPIMSTGWLVLVRFLAPALVIVVLLQKVGILDADELLHRLLN